MAAFVIARHVLLEVRDWFCFYFSLWLHGMNISSSFDEYLLNACCILHTVKDQKDNMILNCS